MTRRPALLTVLVLGTALRVVAMVGYPRALWFGGDSGTYVEAGLNLKPSLLRPSGYSVLLWMLRPFHSLAVVAGVQHLLGLVAGVLVYTLVWRAFRAPRRPWHRDALAALAAAPVLLDAYQIELEHLLMADQLFMVLALAAFAVLTWKEPSWRTAAAAGGLLGLTVLVRSVGLPLLLIGLVWLVVRRAGWRPVVAAAGVFAIPVVAYAVWFHAIHKTWGLTRTDSIWLYGRTADFANCAVIKPPADLRPLCPRPAPAGVAPANDAMWGASSGLRTYPDGIGGVAANDAAGRFARLAIERQPLDYLGDVVRDTLRAFAWGHEDYPTAATVAQYRFPVRPAAPTALDASYAARYDSAAQTANEPFAGWLRGYQRWAFLPGPLLGAIMAIGLAGVVRRWREWGGAALLPWVTALGLLAAPAATADFDYRYVLPAVPFACLAAAFAVINGGSRRSSRPPESGHPTERDRTAVG